MSRAPLRPDTRPARSVARSLSRAVVALSALTLLAGCSGPDEAAVPSDDASPSGSGAPAALAESDLWMSFDEPEVSDPGEMEFADTVSRGVVGRVVSANGGTVDVVEGPEGSGSALQFPPVCVEPTGCPRVLVEIESDPVLEPGEGAFAFGATVWLDPADTTSGSNIVQKGRFATDGGLWKLQVDNDEGQPSCVLRSGDTLLRVLSSVSIADSTWHRVQCTRDAEGIGIAVDGVEDRTSGTLGSVDNEWPIRIGSPGVGEGDDQFHGRIDDVFLRLATPS